MWTAFSCQQSVQESLTNLVRFVYLFHSTFDCSVVYSFLFLIFLLISNLLQLSSSVAILLIHQQEIRESRPLQLSWQVWMHIQAGERIICCCFFYFCAYIAYRLHCFISDMPPPYVCSNIAKRLSRISLTWFASYWCSFTATHGSNLLVLLFIEMECQKGSFSMWVAGNLRELGFSLVLSFSSFSCLVSVNCSNRFT